VPAPQQGVRQVTQAAQVELPSVPELSTEQFMLLRQLTVECIEKFYAELPPRTEESPVTLPEVPDNIQLAKATLQTIDDTLVAIAVHAEAAEKAAAAAAAAPAVAAATFAPATRPSIVPAAPTASYVAGRVGGRPHVGGARVQRNAAMAPRRVARGGSPGSPLPPVIVKMDNGRSVVQNQEEVAAARAEALAQRTAQVVVPAPETVASAEVVSAEAIEGDAQG
jgi:hypothetical protein